jgi:hypothetical protein
MFLGVRLMDKTAPTLELRDIHLPDDPSIWPLAFGWWLLIIIVSILIYVLVKKWQQLRKQKQLIDLMQIELNNINENFKTHTNKRQLASEISELLKRFVRHILKDNSATSLTGTEWVEYLNKQTGSSHFSQFESELTQAQYLPQTEYDASQLITAVKNYFPAAIKQNNKIIRGSKHA